MCAIFDKSSPPNGQMMDAPVNSKSVIRVYDEAGNVIETHEHAAQFKG
jgi:hypothetical protein